MKIIDDLKLQYRMGGMANKLIYWNVAVFLLCIPFFYSFSNGGFEYPIWLSLSSNAKWFLPFLWTFLTYGFLHGGFFHLFFNMIILNFSSRLFLTYFNDKQYLGLYLLSIIFAGICFVISYNLLNFESNIVGASGAVMAILVAATTYQPLTQLRLFLIGNVKLWQVTGVLVLLDAMQIFTDNTGGHIAHLGGSLFGFTYIKLLENGTDLSTFVTKLIDFFTNLFKPSKKTPFKKVHVNYNKKPNTNATESKIVLKDKSQQQIDDILDKISKSGYDSLSQQEKDFLFKAGK